MTGWLIDKSALVRLAASEDAQQWAERIQRGFGQNNTVTRLEVGLLHGPVRICEQPFTSTVGVDAG